MPSCETYLNRRAWGHITAVCRESRCARQRGGGHTQNQRTKLAQPSEDIKVGFKGYEIQKRLHRYCHARSWRHVWSLPPKLSHTIYALLSDAINLADTVLFLATRLSLSSALVQGVFATEQQPQLDQVILSLAEPLIHTPAAETNTAKGAGGPAPESPTKILLVQNAVRLCTTIVRIWTAIGDDSTANGDDRTKLTCFLACEPATQHAPGQNSQNSAGRFSTQRRHAAHSNSWSTVPAMLQLLGCAPGHVSVEFRTVHQHPRSIPVATRTPFNPSTSQ